MAGELFPPGTQPQWWVPALAHIVELLGRLVHLTRFTANDPETAERCVLTSEPTAVTDAAAVPASERAIDEDQIFSTCILTFDEASGRGRYRLDGPNPTQTVGVQIPSGGGELTIVGAWNIRSFRVIGEAGQALQFTSQLFRASQWIGER